MSQADQKFVVYLVEFKHPESPYWGYFATKKDAKAWAVRKQDSHAERFNGHVNDYEIKTQIVTLAEFCKMITDFVESL